MDRERERWIDREGGRVREIECAWERSLLVDHGDPWSTGATLSLSLYLSLCVSLSLSLKQERGSTQDRIKLGKRPGSRKSASGLEWEKARVRKVSDGYTKTHGVLWAMWVSSERSEQWAREVREVSSGWGEQWAREVREVSSERSEQWAREVREVSSGYTVSRGYTEYTGLEWEMSTRGREREEGGRETERERERESGRERERGRARG
jgi:hypothetical protein